MTFARPYEFASTNGNCCEACGMPHKPPRQVRCLDGCCRERTADDQLIRAPDCTARVIEQGIPCPECSQKEQKERIAA